MASVKVLFFPGLMGSNLKDTQTNTLLWGGPTQFIFGANATGALPILQGRLSQLHLRDDGTSINPNVSEDGLVGYYYDLIKAQVLAQGWDFIPCAYDWRHTAVWAAQQLLQTTLANLSPTTTYHVVAHSYGTIVARTLMALVNNYAMFGKVFLCGGPARGSADAVQPYFGIGETYATIVKLAYAGLAVRSSVNPIAGSTVSAFIRQGWRVVSSGSVAPNLDKLLQEIDGLISLFPDLPFLFDSAWWSGNGVPLTATRLARCHADLVTSRAALPAPFAAANVNCIAGTGVNTATMPLILTNPKQAASYGNTTDGDGKVTTQTATSFGGVDFIVTQNHSELLRDPNVLNYIINTIRQALSLPPAPNVAMSMLPPLGTPPQPGVVTLNQAVPIFLPPFSSTTAFAPQCPKRNPLIANNALSAAPPNWPGLLPTTNLATQPNVLTRGGGR